MNKTLNIEELLKPRYKVIADYPGTEFEIGDILKCADDGQYLTTCSGWMGLSKFPSIFKKLEWWEEREPEEMPKYLKHEDGEIVEVAAWDYFKGERVAFRDKRLTYFEWFNPKAQPATETEYNSFIQSNKKSNHE